MSEQETQETTAQVTTGNGSPSKRPTLADRDEVLREIRAHLQLRGCISEKRGHYLVRRIDAALGEDTSTPAPAPIGFDWTETDLAHGVTPGTNGTRGGVVRDADDGAPPAGGEDAHPGVTRDGLLADLAYVGITPIDEDGPAWRAWEVAAEPQPAICDSLREALLTFASLEANDVRREHAGTPTRPAAGADRPEGA